MSDRSKAAIIASLKAAKTSGNDPYRGGAANLPTTGTGLSPLVQQYQQWTTGREPQQYLPRPADEFLTGGFGPLTPIEPMPIDAPEESGRPDPRRYVYRVGWNLPVGEPGIEGLKLADFNTLRTLADLYSVARACIRLRKNELRSIEWDIVPTREAEKRMRGDRKAHADFHDRRDEAVKFFKNPDPEYGTFSSWIDAILEEVLVFDALSLHILPYWGKGKGLLGSDIKALELLSGPTIRPLVDLHGARPRPPLPAYQQYIYGVPRTDLTQVITERDLIDNPDLSRSRVRDYRGDQLIYAPYTKRVWTPYGFPPIEQALIPTISGLRKQGYQLDFFAEGTVPAAYISPGDATMTPQQIRELQDALNAIAGDTAFKHKIIVLPPGSKIDPQKPVDLADKFDEVVMTQVCMAFDVMPMELGIMPGKSTSATAGAGNQMHKMSEDANDRRARIPTLLWLKETIFDKILQQVCGMHDMQWMWEGLEEDEDEKTKTDLIVEQISNGLLSIDEGRIELGKSPWGLPITSDPGFIVQGGFTPLGEYNPVSAQPGAEPGDPDWTPPGQPAPSQPPASGAPASAAAAAAAAAKPGAQVVPGDRSPQTGTPSHAAGEEAGKPTSGATKPSNAVQVANVREAPEPVKKTIHRGQDAELDALRRHLRKGRTVASWTPRHLDTVHLNLVTTALKTESGDPDAAIALVKTMFQPEAVKAGPFDSAKHPRGSTGSTTGGQFVSGSAGASDVAAPVARPTQAQEATHQQALMESYGIFEAKPSAKKPASKKPATKPKAKKTTRRKRLTAKQRAERAAQRKKIKALHAKLMAERKKARLLAAQHRQALAREHQRELAAAHFRSPGGQRQEQRLSQAALRQHAALGKAAGPSQWPGWDLDLDLIAIYAKKIGVALAQAIEKIRDQLVKLIRGGVTADQAVVAIEQSVGSTIAPVLDDLWYESWALGDRSALAKVVGGEPDWADWKPGDPDAARLVVDEEAFNRLLESYGIDEIKSIADSYMTDATRLLHDALERGASADELARELSYLLANSDRAKMIAQTETARAVSRAAENRYREAGIEKVQWVTAMDERVCPICDGNEEAGPTPVGSSFPSGVSSPPGHPRCRCVVIPALPKYDDDSDSYLSKCLTCGCDMPHNEHDDHRHVTIEDLEAAAEAAGITVEEAYDNLVHTTPHEWDNDEATPRPDHVSKVKKPKHQSAYEQMLEDYPPDAIQWMHDARWEGPTRVPALSVDYGKDDEWQASHERDKVERFKKKIKKRLDNGKPIKPVVLVKTPENDKFTVIDGHHRALAYRELGEPLLAWVGHVDKERGPWLETHSSQYPASMRETTDDDTKDGDLYRRRVDKEN